MKKYLFVQDGFYKQAKKLRAVFDEKFADPKKASSERFVWDFWHVPDQYTLLRTPADYFFPKKIYQDFLNHLGEWAQETLGCSAITPPWLSYYIEGCSQQLHSDVPHGPWAFVYSLSPEKIKFQGGETLILKPQTLDYWRNFQDAKDRELNSFVDRIVPKFNRLVVFDPRIPHGVTPVKGIIDPREARLVLHGWFTEPKPYIKGALSARQSAQLLDEAVGLLAETLTSQGSLHGVLSLRLKINKNGFCQSISVLADTLVSLEGNSTFRVELHEAIKVLFKGIVFPKAKEGTEITLPLLFR